MNPNVEELARFVSYPLTRRWHYDWPSIEADLGMPLPGEYKEYATYFPPGVYCGVITPEHPALRGGDLTFRERIQLIADLLRDDRPVTGAQQMPFYPEPGGLIPWAMYESTVALCWLPDSEDPDHWPVFAYDEEHLRERIPGSTIPALISVLRGEAGRSVLSETFYRTLGRYYGGPYMFNGDEGSSPDVELGPVEYLGAPAADKAPEPGDRQRMRRQPAGPR